MEKKLFKGNINKNIAFGLTWLLSFCGFGAISFGWIAALVMLIIDKDVLDVEEKRELASVIICAATSTLLGLTFIVPLYNFVCIIISAIKAFTGGSFQIPGIYHIAKLIIK